MRTPVVLFTALAITLGVWAADQRSQGARDAAGQGGPAGEEAILEALRGVWVGKLESQGRDDGRIYYATSVILEVTGGGPPRGRFALGTGEHWEGTVEVKGGKVLMHIDYGTQEFSLVKKKDELLLEASYDPGLGGWPRVNTITLKKQ